MEFVHTQENEWKALGVQENPGNKGWWAGGELQASSEVTGSNADECFLYRCSK